MNKMSDKTNPDDLHKAVDTIKQEIAKVIVGQQDMVRLVVAAILADGHVLIEGVPGIAKNTDSKTDCPLYFCRIQTYTIYSGFNAIRYSGDFCI